MRRLWFAAAPVIAALLACGGAATAPVAEAPPPAAPAADAPPALQTAWVVLLAGSPDHDEAEARHTSARSDPRTPTVGAHPRLAHSDEIAGLKPGFWVVVGATLDDEATAATMAKALGTRWDGAYVREVQVPPAEIESVRCPADPRCKATAAPAWRVLIVFDHTDGMESEDWVAASERVIERGKAAGIDARWQDEDWVQDVVVDGKKVTELDITPFAGELFGYVFAEEGREPIYQAHDRAETVISAAEAYYGVTFGK